MLHIRLQTCTYENRNQNDDHMIFMRRLMRARKDYYVADKIHFSTAISFLSCSALICLINFVVVINTGFIIPFWVKFHTQKSDLRWPPPHPSPLPNNVRLFLYFFIHYLQPLLTPTWNQQGAQVASGQSRAGKSALAFCNHKLLIFFFSESTQIATFFNNKNETA